MTTRTLLLCPLLLTSFLVGCGADSQSQLALIDGSEESIYVGDAKIVVLGNRHFAVDPLATEITTAKGHTMTLRAWLERLQVPTQAWQFDTHQIELIFDGAEAESEAMPQPFHRDHQSDDDPSCIRADGQPCDDVDETPSEPPVESEPTEDDQAGDESALGACEPWVCVENHDQSVRCTEYPECYEHRVDVDLPETIDEGDPWLEDYGTYCGNGGEDGNSGDVLGGDEDDEDDSSVAGSSSGSDAPSQSSTSTAIGNTHSSATSGGYTNPNPTW